jgi:integrase
MERRRKPYSIFRRPTKRKRRFIFYARFRHPVTGTYQNAVSTGCGNRDEAVKWCEARLAQEQASSERLGGYLSGFWTEDSEYTRKRALAGRPLIRGYLAANRSPIEDRILPYLRDQGKEALPLGQVSRELVEAAILHLSDSTELSPARINGIRKSLTVPLRRAFDLGKIKIDPTRGALLLKEPKVKRRVLSLEEARAFFALEWLDERLRLINMLAASTGLRLGECRGLLQEDLREEPYLDAQSQKAAYCYIALRHNWIDGEGLKTLKWRHEMAEDPEAFEPIPLPSGLSEKLRELGSSNPWGNGFVFWSARAKAPISKSWVEETFNAAVLKLGISEEERRRRRLSFHAWRWWYNTRMRGSIQDHVLRQITRHKSAAMTEKYTTGLTADQGREIARLAERLL